MRMRPIEWAREYAATMTDLASLRNVRMFAKENLAHNADIRSQIVDAGGETLAKAEWDPHFAHEDEEDYEAIRLIEARLTELGVSFD